MGEDKTYLSHLIVYFPDSPGNNDAAMLVSQIALVRFPIPLFSESDKLFNERIIRNGLSDVIDLTAFVMTIRIWQKENLIYRDDMGSYINQDAVWPLPNGMKLSLYKNSWPMPDRPPNLLFSAVGKNMLWNDIETFVDWFIGQGVYRNVNTFASNANVSTQ